MVVHVYYFKLVDKLYSIYKITESFVQCSIYLTRNMVINNNLQQARCVIYKDLQFLL